jgi:hypothetical protein
MIRVIGIQRAETPAQEFVLLQNQGSMRTSLRGHVLMAESALAASGQGAALHAFADEVMIPAGMYVILGSGCGVPRWGRTKEGGLLYFAYMGRDRSVWTELGPLHLLNTHHSFVERRECDRRASAEARSAVGVY